MIIADCKVGYISSCIGVVDAGVGKGSLFVVEGLHSISEECAEVGPGVTPTPTILSADQGSVFIMAGVPYFWNLLSKCAAGWGSSFTPGCRSPLPLTEVTKLVHEVKL